MKVIGLTGASGSGKSTIAKLLCLPVIDADEISRQVVSSNSDCLDMLCKQFGNDILNNDKTLNRKVLAQKAFSNEESTNLLNSITHPFIVKKIKEQIELQRSIGKKAVVLDAPQLFEAGCETLCDITVGVISEKALRTKRIIFRDKISEKEALLRINAGKSDSFFTQKCDIIINNDENLTALKKNAYDILNLI